MPHRQRRCRHGEWRGRDLLALLAIADRALYRAKANGRNRVAPAPPVLVPW